MKHIVEVDQSGKVEDTKEDTVVALANGTQFSVRIPATVKRACIQALRLQGRPASTFYLQLYTIALYFLLREHIGGLSRVMIDSEYMGQEVRIQEFLLNMLHRHGYQASPQQLHFTRVGKSSPAHTVAGLHLLHLEPSPYGLRDNLRSIIASQLGWCFPLDNDALKHLQNLAALHPCPHLECQTRPRKLLCHRQNLQPLPSSTSIMNAVVGPAMMRVRRLNRPGFRSISSSFPWPSGRDTQTLLAPAPLYPLHVAVGQLPTDERRRAAIAIARVCTGNRPQSCSQLLVLQAPHRSWPVAPAGTADGAERATTTQR